MYCGIPLSSNQTHFGDKDLRKKHFHPAQAGSEVGLSIKFLNI